jgi:DNA recombination protein RmuC
MNETLLIVLIAVALANLLLTVFLARRDTRNAARAVEEAVVAFDKSISRFETAMKDDFARSRDESGRNARELREEQLQAFKSLTDSTLGRMKEMADLQKNQLDVFSQNLSGLMQTTVERLDRMTEAIEKRFAAIQETSDLNSRANREELARSLESFRDQFRGSIEEFNRVQNEKFTVLEGKQGELVQTTELRFEKVREVLETKLKAMQDDNSEKLERMRLTVDEKLHKTLEERLGDSFKLVSDRLELVHRGLGEMQTLATGVGDLKRVLANVKTRGTLGEYRLESILEQLLSPEQYGRNVCTKADSRDVVEFAIRLPGKEDPEKAVWLPLDSKFPQSKYEALIDAYDAVNPELIERSVKDLETAVKIAAKDIRDKYLDPPNTTDFAIMFLPIEGLYAEVVKRPALFEVLQREYHVTVAGPSTLAAILNSLQMGFRTLAIEKRSSEVWSLLGAVKTEFHRFGDMLDGVQKNLDAASRKISTASSKSRTIERKLRKVQELPSPEAIALIEDSLEADEDTFEESNNSDEVRTEP